ncbi:hypothetical protein BTJ27_03670 [Lactobacillus delbrueckii subsp. bulgaricus]|nr:hypothetical protein [Lactobacillus delbrueckii subsp. bulgaricus]
MRKSKWSDGSDLPPRTLSTPGAGPSTRRLLLNILTSSPGSRTLTLSLPARSQSALWGSRLLASTSWLSPWNGGSHTFTS